MIDEALEELHTAIEKAQGALKRELSKLRTGRAHSSLLESIRVNSYGTLMPITQMATVTAPEARLLVVKVWDKSQLKLVEKAISQSPLGLNPQNDGDIIRVPLPMLSEERRKELCKIARRTGEETKVTIRKARHDTKDLLSSLKEEKEVGEDDVERALKKVEEIVQQATNEVDAIVVKKEKDILEV
ncbi:MAG: ribosome recycling factor [Deltaproteobacteria bacterium]|nr:ribosome recycling factor [Deltaproteobacteria bacterium]